MLEIGLPDLSFRELLREGSRRRDDALDEVRERVAGFLAIGFVVAAPFCWLLSRSEIFLPELSLVEESQAAEPSAGPAIDEPRPVGAAAALSRPGADALGAADVRAVQSQLKSLGFDPGPIDGIPGARTLAALNRYRETMHLSPVKAVNRTTVSILPGR